MIRVTRLNGQEMALNAELIETVEATPDTVISLTTGRKVLVRESPEEVTSRVMAYRRALAGLECGPAGCGSGRAASESGPAARRKRPGYGSGAVGRGRGSEVKAP